MAEPITCPSCGEPLDLADEHRGWRVRCPLCRHEFVAGRPAAPTVPTAQPHRPARRRRYEDDDPEDDERTVARARRIVSGPASWLRVLGGLCVFFGLLAAAWAAVGAVWHNDDPVPARQAFNAQDDDEMAVTLTALGVGGVVWAGFGGVMMYGAMKMGRLESYSWAIVSTVMALITVLCCCGVLVGVPVGIWALSIMNRPEVKDGFAIVAERRPDAHCRRASDPGRRRPMTGCTAPSPRPRHPRCSTSTNPAA